MEVVAEPERLEEEGERPAAALAAPYTLGTTVAAFSVAGPAILAAAATVEAAGRPPMMAPAAGRGMADTLGTAVAHLAQGTRIPQRTADTGRTPAALRSIIVSTVPSVVAPVIAPHAALPLLAFAALLLALYALQVVVVLCVVHTSDALPPNFEVTVVIHSPLRSAKVVVLNSEKVRRFAVLY